MVGDYQRDRGEGSGAGDRAARWRGRRGEALPVFPAGALLLILLLSLGLYFARRPWVQRVLFFPQFQERKLVGEQRFLPRRGGLEGNVELYLEELILGPARPALDRVVPKNVRLLSVIARHGTVYASFSREIITGRTGASLSLAEELQSIANGLLFNFPQIHSLFLLVEGQLPGEQFADGFHYEKKIVK
jgi:hypothetical protein